MARQLRTSGESIASLIMLDTTLPEPGFLAHFDEGGLLRAMAAELGCTALFESRPGVEPPHSLSDLVARAHEAGLLPREITLARASRIADVFRHTVTLYAAYRPQAQPGPVTVVRAQRRERAGDPLPDWSPFITQLTNVDMPCTHGELVSPVHAAMVVDLALNARHRRTHEIATD